MAVPGWYPDPLGDPARIRYWDGVAWTEHFHPYRPAPPPAPPARRPTSLKWLGVIAVAGLLAGLAGELFALLAELNSRNLAGDLLDGMDTSYAQLRGAQAWLEDAETVRGIGWLVGALAFVPWFYCAYRNLPRLGRGESRFGAGWAIGAWFVPLLNLVRPKLIADEIYLNSDGETTLTGLGFVHCWWALLIGSAIAQRIGITIVNSADDVSVNSQRTFSAVLEKAEQGYLIEAVAAGMVIVAAALAALFVLRVTAAQREMADPEARRFQPALTSRA
jgi:hypothetical protein